MSKVPGFIPLSDYLPAENRPAIGDDFTRNVYLKGGVESEHSTLTVGNTQTKFVSQRLRIRRVRVAGVTGGTVTVQVYANGRPLFDDTTRPVSDAGDSEVTDLYLVQAGAVIETVIEADSGTPAGTANVAIDTEPHVLVPTSRAEALRGKDKLKVSKRRQSRSVLDDRIRELDRAFVARSSGGVGSTSPTGGSSGGEGSGGESGAAPISRPFRPATGPGTIRR